MRYINPPTRPIKPKKEIKAEKTPQEIKKENYEKEKGSTIGILVVVSLILFMLLAIAIYAVTKGI